MRLPFSSPFLRGYGKKIAAGLCFLLAGPVMAAQNQMQMPVLFDSRERIPGALLTSVPRVRFLTSTDFPPFNFIDQDGRLAGFHVDLVREICAELEIAARCQIQALPYDELEGALERGEGEAVIAGVAVTDALRARFAFSRPYMTMPARFARNLSVRIGSDNPLELRDATVGVVTGSRHEAMFRVFFPQLKSTGFEKREDALQALKENRVAAVFADGLRLPFWVAGEASGGCCAMLGGPYISSRFLGEGLSIMTRQQDTALVPALDHALSALSADGRLQEIYRRYFPFGFY